MTTSVSFVFAIYKIISGSFTNLSIAVTGILSLLLVVSNVITIIGSFVGKNKVHSYSQSSASFLLVAGIAYILYMIGSLFIPLSDQEYSRVQTVILTLMGLVELALAIGGIARGDEEGYYFQNLKFVSLSSALVAVVTAEIALLTYISRKYGSAIVPIQIDALSFYTETDVSTIIIGISGIYVGIAAIVLAVYIFKRPDRKINRDVTFLFTRTNLGRKDPNREQYGKFDELLIKHSHIGEIHFTYTLIGDEAEGELKGSKIPFEDRTLGNKIWYLLIRLPILVFWPLNELFADLDHQKAAKRLVKEMRPNFALKNYEEVNEKLVLDIPEPLDLPKEEPLLVEPVENSAKKKSNFFRRMKDSWHARKSKKTKIEVLPQETIPSTSVPYPERTLEKKNETKKEKKPNIFQSMRNKFSKKNKKS